MSGANEFKISQIVDNGHMIQLTLIENVSTEPISQKQMIIETEDYKVKFSEGANVEDYLKDLFVTKKRNPASMPVVDIVFDKKTKRYTKHRGVGAALANGILSFTEGNL